MRVKYLFKCRFCNERVNVPNFEHTANGSNQKVIFVNLVQKGWALLVVDRHVDALVSGFDVDVDNEDLLVVEARHSQNRGRRLQESLSVEFDNCVSCAGLGSSNQNWGNRWLCLLLLVLFFFIFIIITSWLLGRGLFFLFIFVIGSFWLFLDDNDFLYFWLGLKMGQCFCITIKVEQLRDSVGLTQR